MKPIEVKNLFKSYIGDHPVLALDNISFEVNEKEMFGLIGPDGAGKTTLFRILTTLLLADKGTARVLGTDVVKDYKSIRNRIGYMPGRFSLYQDLSIEENLIFFAKVYDTSMEQNYDMIKDIYVQIEPFKKRKAGNLSGGMKQKLALCCALVHKPELLFLDEPTTGVDPESRKEFWEMLKILKNSISILVSTPYMDEAAMCDRIALIQNGKLMEIDTPQAIITHFPHTLYGVKADSNYKLLEQLNKQKNVHSCYISGEYLRVVFSDDNHEITYPNLHIVELPPTIEDCFIELMTKNGSNSN